MGHGNRRAAGVVQGAEALVCAGRIPVQRAIDVAKEKVMNRLNRIATEFIEGKPFALHVESVKPGMPPWRLLRNEGFLFFPTDEQDA